jgi:penicillin G amidase
MGDESRSLARPGLAPVEIVRDSFGVAHVEAPDEAGALYGAGFAAAEDRLFQMCWTRVLYQGRAAEFLGAGPVASGGEGKHVRHDRTARLIGWRRAADREVLALDLATRALLEAYAAGVDEWMRLARGGLEGATLHPLFAQLGLVPEPWLPRDCVGVWHRFTRHYGSSGLEEALQLREVEGLRAQGLSDDEIVEELFGDVQVDDDAAVVQPSDVPASVQQAMHAYAQAHQLEPALLALVGDDGPHFSHAWVVSGARTASDEAVLVGEPRIPISVPSLLYEWHMRCPSFDVLGAGAAGSPCLLVGAGTRNSWSVTALGVDQTDLFALEVQPNGSRYVVDGVARAWEVDEPETILVAGAPPVSTRYRRSIFGPVVTEVVEGALPGEQFAQRSVIDAFPALSTHRGLLDMYRAQGIEAFRAAVGGWVFPGVNMVFASAEGRVGYTIAGAWPVRRPAAFLPGFLPQDGTRSDADWIGLLPHDLKPWTIDPPRGWIVSANNNPVGSWYPIPRIFGVSGDNDRSRRARERLAPLDQAAPEEIVGVRLDDVVPTSRDITRLGRHLQDVQGVVLSGPARRALVALGPWLDAGAHHAGSEAAAALANFVPSTLRLAFGAPQALIDAFGSGVPGMASWLKTRTAALDLDPGLVLGPDDQAFLDALLARAFRETRHVAGDPGQWPAWYEANVLSGEIALWSTLEEFAPLEPGTVAWGPLDVAVGTTLRSPPSEVYSLAARLGGPAATSSLLPFGQSEHAGSPHFLDQLALWHESALKTVRR